MQYFCSVHTKYMSAARAVISFLNIFSMILLLSVVTGIASLRMQGPSSRQRYRHVKILFGRSLLNVYISFMSFISFLVLLG